MARSFSGWSVARLGQFIRNTLRNKIYLKEQTTAPDIRDDVAEVVLYAKDDSGTTKLFYKDSTGTEVAVGGGGDLKNHIFALYASVSAHPDAGYFMPWVGYVESQSIAAGSIGTMRCTMIAPYDGKFISVGVLCNGSGAPGSTIIGVHKNNNATAMETQTVTISSFNTTYTGTFTSNSFSKGDALHLNLNATLSLDYVTAIAVIEYDEST